MKTYEKPELEVYAASEEMLDESAIEYKENQLPWK